MHDTPLNVYLGKDSVDSIRKAFQAIHTSDENIFAPTLLKFSQQVDTFLLVRVAVHVLKQFIGERGLNFST